jgi:hypothetical protein
MTNTQLYLSMGIPMLFNAVMFMLFWSHLNTRFDDAKETWRAELRRVEEVLDARLKAIEDGR